MLMPVGSLPYRPASSVREAAMPAGFTASNPNINSTLYLLSTCTCPGIVPKHVLHIRLAHLRKNLGGR